MEKPISDRYDKFLDTIAFDLIGQETSQIRQAFFCGSVVLYDFLKAAISDETGNAIPKAYQEKLTSIRGEIDLFAKNKAIEFDGTVYLSFLKYLDITRTDANKVGIDPIRSGFYAGAHSMDMLFFEAIDFKNVQSGGYVEKLTNMQAEVEEFSDALDAKIISETRH